MTRPSSQHEYMSLDHFEELLPDKPADEKWELIGGRVVRMMVGARCRPLESGASALNDPTVLVEVMSEGSKTRDRFENGRSIRSCRACGTTCLSSATGRISRSSTASATSGRACASATDWRRRWDLPAVDASVPLAEIYRDVIEK